MAKEAEKKIIQKWIKPDSRAEVDKLLLKNLEGFAKKGARVECRGFYPTGHFNLDFAIRYGTLPVNVDLSSLKNFNPREVGGAPKAKIVEVFGEPGGGKTSLCQRIVGNAQKRKTPVMWVDRENSFSEDLGIINGMDLDDCYMMAEPGIPAEDCFDHMYKAMESGIELIVLDSVAGLIPRYVYENDSSKDTVALLARVMGKCMPKLADLSAKTGCTVIFINQIRQKPGVIYGDPTTTPGGETLKFFSSLRMQISKRYAKDAEVYKEDDNGVEQLIAQESLVYIRKNRFAKNLRESIPVPIYFEPYFPSAEEVAFDVGRQTQVVKVLKGKFYWKTPDDQKIEGEGRKAFIQALVDGRHVPALIDSIKAEADEQEIVLPPELLTFELLDDKKVKRKEIVRTKESQIIDEYLQQDALSPQEASIDASAEAVALLDDTKVDHETHNTRGRKKKAG